MFLFTASALSWDMWASIHMQPLFEGLQSVVDSSPSDESSSLELNPHIARAVAAGERKGEKKVILFNSLKVIYKY